MKRKKFYGPENDEVVKPIVEEETKKLLDAPKETVEEPVTEKDEEVEAVVHGVQMSLNIRKDPEVKPNNQIAILTKGTKIIVVNPKKPVKNGNTEWYKVRLHKDADPSDEENNGYAMKKYIKIL